MDRRPKYYRITKINQKKYFQQPNLHQKILKYYFPQSNKALEKKNLTNICKNQGISTILQPKPKTVKSHNKNYLK